MLTNRYGKLPSTVRKIQEAPMSPNSTQKNSDIYWIQIPTHKIILKDTDKKESPNTYSRSPRNHSIISKKKGGFKLRECSPTEITTRIDPTSQFGSPNDVVQVIRDGSSESKSSS